METRFLCEFKVQYLKKKIFPTHFNKEPNCYSERQEVSVPSIYINTIKTCLNSKTSQWRKQLNHEHT